MLDTEQGVPFRLMVHDNASSDGTVAALTENVPEAEVRASDRNLGFAAAVNSLVSRSDAKWFLTLNSDAWPHPGMLAALVRAGNQHPAAAAIAPRVVRPDGSPEPNVQPFPTPAAALRLALPGYARLSPDGAARWLLPNSWRPDVARSVDWAVGACLLIRRAAWEDVGGLDESLFMYGEDLDWCWRAHRHGWSIRYEPSAVATHLGNASGKVRFRGRRDAISLRNSYRVAARHQGRLSTNAARSLHVAWALREWLAAPRRSGAAAYWRAYLQSHAAAVRQERESDRG
jgi:GT2 family glycosyltransferase